MHGTMVAAVLHRAGVLQVDEVPIPQIPPDGVLVRIRAVGICGSDVHFYQDGRLGPFVVEKPFILGHESAGEIVEVGPEAKALKVGTRVAIEPGIVCRKCRLCLSGRYNLCPNVDFLSAPPVDGVMCEYVAVPEQFAFPIPDSFSFRDGAMMEPLSVGVQAVLRARLRPGATVAILGGGPIGLVTLAAARAAGAGKTIVAERIPLRIETAKAFGASRVVDVEKESIAEVVAEETGGAMADYVFECAGSVPTASMATDLAGRAATVAFVGWPGQREFPIKVEDVIDRELDLVGVNRYANTYPTAIALVADGRVDVSALVTHAFPLERVREAFDFVIEHKAETIKVVVEP